jgi:hypothetical protein
MPIVSEDDWKDMKKDESKKYGNKYSVVSFI